VLEKQFSELFVAVEKNEEGESNFPHGKGGIPLLGRYRRKTAQIYLVSKLVTPSHAGPGGCMR
jgi:hypothetical protein